MNNQTPLVSVIIPIFNVEKYLQKCIDSVLAQTYTNLEIILINDGSTDKSGEIADYYSKKNKNIKVIHQKNGGLSSARNTGIKHAKGEWLTFVDSDDYIKKNFVAKLLSLAQKNDADIASCSLKTFSDDESILKKSPTWPNKTLSGQEAINDMMKNKRPAYICLSIFRTSLFEDNKIRFPEGKEYEDIATRIKLLYHAEKVSFTDEKLYYYLIRKGSITGKKFSKTRYDDFQFALKDIRNFLKETGDISNYLFLSYFEFYSLITLLNYLAREKTQDPDAIKYWKELRKKLKSLYKITNFPTTKAKLISKSLLVISSNKTFYSAIYRKVKNENKS